MSNGWEASLHPRDERGRFRAVNSHDVAATGYPVERLRTSRLSSLFASALDEAEPAVTAFDRIVAELGRRDEIRVSRSVNEWTELLTQDRRTGESRRQAMRRVYDEWVYLRYLKAETDTRGHLVTKAATANMVDALSLFGGTTARALRWASEDLKRWWDANGGRVTFTQFVSGRPVADFALAR